MVFVYWDNSNIYHEAQRLAEERDGTPGARYLVRVHFDNLLRLAHADRPVTRAVAAGSIPAETRGVFIPLDDYYDAITFREPSRPGYEFAPPRDQAPLDLTRRPMARGVQAE